MEVDEKEIRQWFERGKSKKWSYMTILVNHLDGCFRPIYFDLDGNKTPEQSARSHFSSSTESILETYNLKKDFKKQVRSV
jgi:hypothetical protein